MTISIVSIIVAIIIACLLWWALVTIAPPEPIQKICKVLLVVVFVLWILSSLGLLGSHLRIADTGSYGPSTSLTPSSTISV